MNRFLSRLTVRSFVVILFVIGSLILAARDPSFRPTYGHLADVAVGGYLGQLLPQSAKEI